jgi:hypothetical protein
LTTAPLRHPRRFHPFSERFFSLFYVGLLTAQEAQSSKHAGLQAQGWSGRLVAGEKEFENGGSNQRPLQRSARGRPQMTASKCWFWATTITLQILPTLLHDMCSIVFAAPKT